MKKKKDPFSIHLRVLRSAIRSQHSWRGSGPYEDYPIWDQQKRGALLALHNLHEFALKGLIASRKKK